VQKNWALWAALTLVLAGAIAVLYVLFAAASKPEPSTGLTRFATGEMANLTTLEAPPPMPTRAIRDASGAETTLHAFQGDVLVVNVWATWCAPCVEELPTLGELQRRFDGRLRVITVSIDSEGKREQAQRELAERGGNALPFLIDITRGILFDVQGAGMPVTIIYGRDGDEIARLAGGADWSSDEAVALMEAVLAEEGS
jgi:thiol-disulfide isomerase/thioredoxin